MTGWTDFSMNSLTRRRNWRGVLALVVGAVLAVGPFPQDGLIPALKPLYNYNWVVGFAAAFILYAALTAMTAGRPRVSQHAYADNS